jgi:hypothetical protein
MQSNDVCLIATSQTQVSAHSSTATPLRTPTKLSASVCLSADHEKNKATTISGQRSRNLPSLCNILPVLTGPRFTIDHALFLSLQRDWDHLATTQCLSQTRLSMAELPIRSFRQWSRSNSLLKPTLKNCLDRINQSSRRTIANCSMSLTSATTMPRSYTSTHRIRLPYPHLTSQATISAAAPQHIRLLPDKTHYTRTRSNTSKPTKHLLTNKPTTTVPCLFEHRQTTPTSTPSSHRKATAAADP